MRLLLTELFRQTAGKSGIICTQAPRTTCCTSGLTVRIGVTTSAKNIYPTQKQRPARYAERRITWRLKAFGKVIESVKESNEFDFRVKELGPYLDCCIPKTNALHSLKTSEVPYQATRRNISKYFNLYQHH